MAGAEQRYLLHRISEALHPAAGDKRHRLQRFQRAARGGQVMRVAGRVKQLAFLIDDGHRAVMDAVGSITASNDGKGDVRGGGRREMGRGQGSGDGAGRRYCMSSGPSAGRRGIAEATGDA